MPKLSQVSMASGEVSPALYGRVDLARFSTALRRCRNFIVRATGGVTGRPGTELVAVAQNPTKKTRLLPFIFSEEQSYVLAFGDLSASIITRGALVEDLTVMAVITDVQAELIGGKYVRTITTAAAHGLAVLQSVILQEVIASGACDVNGTWNVWQIVSPTQFRILGTGTLFGHYTSGGKVLEPLAIVSPYDENDLVDLAWTQSADVMTIVHGDFWPREFRRLSGNSFEIIKAVFENGPFESLNTAPVSYVHASAGLGVITLTATEDIFLAGHVGALFYIEQQDGHEIPPWEPGKRLAAVAGNPAGLLRSSDGKNYRCVTNYVVITNEIVTGTIRPTHDYGVEADGSGQAVTSGAERAGVDWEYRDSGFGILEITGVLTAKTATARVIKQLPLSVVGGVTTVQGPWTMTGDGADTTLAIAAATSDNKYDYEVTYDGVIQDPAGYSVNSVSDVLTFAVAPAVGVSVSARQLSPNRRTNVWAFGAWSEVNGYPTEVEYSDDRLVFSSTRKAPQTNWMTKVGDYKTFVPSVPLVDDDPITATLNARALNKITDLVPLAHLIILTGRGAWRVLGGSDEVVTPTSISVKPQSRNGAGQLPAVIIGESAIYADPSGQVVYDLEFAIEVNGYTGTNISITSEHLLKGNPAIDISYQEFPLWSIWLPRSDGLVPALTYLKEHEVNGWSLHDFSDSVESVCSVPEEGEYRLYMVVNRPLTGVDNRLIERLARRYPVDLLDHVFMDSTLSYDGRNTSGSTMILSGAGWTVDDTLTVLCSASVFDSDNVGNFIVLRSGTDSARVRLVEYIDPTSMKGNPLSDVPVPLQGTAVTTWEFAKQVFGGLDHLKERWVTVLADGQALDEVLVDANGAVIISEAGIRVHIGLPYLPLIETLDLVIPGAETIIGTAKNIPMVTVQVEDTRGIWAGPNEAKLNEHVPREFENYGETPAPLTGVATIPVDCEWSKTGRVVIAQKKPLPITILSIIPHVRTGGSS